MNVQARPFQAELDPRDLEESRDDQHMRKPLLVQKLRGLTQRGP